MKNIIKAYLQFATGNLSTFDSEYEQFIKAHPIGKAEQSIIDAIYSRARVGYKKYSQTSCRQDYTLADWGQNMLEEILDKEVYKKVLLTNLEENLENPLFLIKFVEFLKKEQ